VTIDVFLDARRMGWNPYSGTGVYADELLAALPDAAPDLQFAALTTSSIVDMSTRAQGLAGRATRWPRKAVSDLVEVGWRGRSARLRHALYPEAVCHGPLVATVQDLVVYDPMFNEGRTRAYYRWRHDRAITSAARVIRGETGPVLSTT